MHAMTAPSRRLILAGLAAATLAAPRPARAAFPDRPLRALIGFVPGTIPDVSMRLLGPGMGERLGQPIVVENRPGAAGAIAVETMLRAPADGHTLLMMPANVLVLSLARKNPGFDAADLLPLAGAVTAPMVLVVPPALGVTDLAGFLRLARERGERLVYAHSGTVASPNLCFSLLAQATGITPTGIAFRGDPEMITNLLSGSAQAAFTFLGSSVPQVRDGRLRALAVTSERRVSQLPDVPTIAELGFPAVTYSGWWTVTVPRATPPEAQRRLIEAVRAVRTLPETVTRMEGFGALPLDRDGAALQAFAAAERERLAALYRAIGVQPE
jgi:tripartite-type tricarboxylate transporter receptor subunit TctC